MPPEIRYARNGDVHIAYQVLGEGPIDLIWVPGFISHLELAWSFPAYERFMNRLGSFARVIVLDRRGVGVSDRADMRALDTQVDDVLAVMDAANAERPALLGYSEGGTLCTLLSAAHPQRVPALILLGTYARFLRGNDYPIGLPVAAADRFVSFLEEHWGTGGSIDLFAPSGSGDPETRRLWAAFERSAASPSAVLELFRQFHDIDIRDVLPAIQAPTLVLHRAGDRAIRSSAGRYLAERIPGARFVELEGSDHIPFFGDAEAILAEIQEFLTGVRPVPEPDRILASVLFTDIVGSTERAAAAGDTEWRNILELHHEVIGKAIERSRGRAVKSTGDGFLAVFDSPTRAVRCALECIASTRALGIEIRAGLHTGECELIGDDVGGIAVHIASRVSSLAAASEVLASRTVRDLSIGSELVFTQRGTHELKGVPETWDLYAVQGGRA